MTFQSNTIAMIDRAMIAAGINQRELSERMGVTEAYVSQLLNSKSNMTLKTVDRVFDAIGAGKPSFKPARNWKEWKATR